MDRSSSQNQLHRVTLACVLLAFSTTVASQGTGLPLCKGAWGKTQKATSREDSAATSALFSEFDKINKAPTKKPDYATEFASAITQTENNPGIGQSNSKFFKSQFDQELWGEAGIVGEKVLSASELLGKSKPALSDKASLTIESVKKKLRESGYDPEPWDKTSAQIATLPQYKQEKILISSGFEYGKPIEPDVPAIVVEKRSQDVERLAETYTAGTVLDPKLKKLIEEHGRRNPGTVVGTGGTSNIKFLTDEANLAAKMAAGLKRIPDPSVQVVGGGSGTPTGGLINVPPGSGPVAMGLVDGVPCVRPATDVDRLNFDRKTGSNGLLWDPLAFPDVGLLIWRQKGVPDYGICSFIRVSPTHIVTAAHCVAKRGQIGGYSLVDFDKTVDALALLPDMRDTPKRPVQCFLQPNDCGFHVAPISGKSNLPKAMRWDYPAKVPTPDLALLEVSFPSQVHKVSTTIWGKAKNKERITLAGYGLTISPDGALSGSLRVGWQSLPPDLDNAVLKWIVNYEKGAAAACAGDSGGAVFHDELASSNQTPRVLAGLVSYGEGKSKAKGLEGCLSLTLGVATRLSPHAEWLCEKSKEAILGCDSVPRAAKATQFIYPPVVSPPLY